MKDTVPEAEALQDQQTPALTDLELEILRTVSGNSFVPRQNSPSTEDIQKTSENSLIVAKKINNSKDVEQSDEETEQIESTSTQPLTADNSHIYEEETKCGFGRFHPDWLQRLASKKTYILVYGLIGMFDFALGTYFISTISTVEKRFKIPSRTTGLISAAWDIGGLTSHLSLAYLGSKGHKTRWVAAGICLAGLSCYLRLVPHLVLGIGQDAFELTREYEEMYGVIHNITGPIEQSGKLMCGSEVPEEDCSIGAFALLPSATLIAAAFILGIGTSMYYTLGISYMDDNIRKNKTPLFLAIWQCIRMLGPTVGFLFGSYAVTQYVDPTLHPVIASNDPRWIGAWWLGWGPFGTILISLAAILALFPKKLPRTAQRMAAIATTGAANVQENATRSFADFKLVLKRLVKNKILLYNSFSSVCFMFGLIGFWVFMPKYMETQFRQSASRASLITGSIGLICSGLGILTAGIVISKFKPHPRYLAAWNVVVELLVVAGHVSYAFLNCATDDLHGEMKPDHTWDLTAECNHDCDCGPRINYSPVCTSDGSTTFYSPCHAGCTSTDMINGTKIYSNCSCIGTDGQGWAVEGACPADCSTIFTIFLVTECVLKFLSSSGRSGNTIIQFRCVKPEDKAVSIAFSEALLAALGFMPGPIVYGMLLDSACIVWGQTCGETGNCWMYDGHRLAFVMNFTASAFLLLGTLLDVGVWYHVKNLQIYDDVETDIVKPKKKRKFSEILKLASD